MPIGLRTENLRKVFTTPPPSAAPGRGFIGAPPARAVRTGKPVSGGAARQEYDELVTTWGVRPRLGELLDA